MSNENQPGGNPLTSLFAKQSEELASTEKREVDKENLAEEVLGFEVAQTLGTANQILDDTTRREYDEAIGHVESLEDMVSRDVSVLPAIRGKADAIMAETEKFILRDAESFRTIADALDSTISTDGRVDHLNLMTVRNYVTALMVTLRTNPEYSGILLDQDVRNILSFARQLYAEAESAADMKAATKQASKSKAASAGAKRVNRTRGSDPALEARMAESLARFTAGLLGKG